MSRCVLAICLLASVVGCRRDDSVPTADSASSPKLQLATLPAAPPTATSTRFHRLTVEQTGVDFANRILPDHPLNRLYHFYVCGGVAVGDVDGDDRVDLFLVNGSEANRLYRQRADFQFEDISSSAGIGGGDAWGTGAAMVDIDNDGDLDIYVCNYDTPNALYINDGSGRFREHAADWKLDIRDASLMPTFQDFDRDGQLDLYLVTYSYYRAGGRPSVPPWQTVGGKPQVLPEFERYYALAELEPGKYTVEEYGRPDYLLRNQGDGTFADVTTNSGIAGQGFGISATWFDFDADGWTDLYVCNDFDSPDCLYRNQQDGTFRDVIADVIPHTTWFSMGSDSGDINNDGLADLICVDMSARSHYKQKTTMGVMNAQKLQRVAGPPPQYMRNTLFLNSGAGRFWELAYQAGVADSDWSWAAKLADFDNDGWLDLFISNGMVRNFNDSDVPFDQRMLMGRTYWDLYRNLPERPEQNLAFRNRSGLRFEDVSVAWGLDHVGMSYGAATADLDQDGDLDLVVVNLNEPVSIYRNDSPSESRGLGVRLRGICDNHFGIGAQVTLHSDLGTQVRQLNPYSGYLASSEPTVHFGLGSAAVERITVDWPSGTRQKVDLTDIMPAPELKDSRGRKPALITVTQAADVQPDAAPPEPMFRAATTPKMGEHREVPFDDFSLQPLLPNKLSQLGPGMAWGDVDADGDDDFYLGGAAGSAGQLWIRDRSREFQQSAQGTFAKDAACEDLGAVFFDADRDDDLDLFVVSGGVEASHSDAQFADRLYLNDGQGRFQRAAANQLPSDRQSGSAVAAADVDRDGDLDLFVAGRVRPGEYPLPADSRLLINEQGKFVDRTAEAAPQLLGSGLATSAVWSDADGDGWIDLLVAHEWGPIKLFRNQHGTLHDQTEQAGLRQWTGWWTSIAAGDLNGDQHVDYVVGNFGRNTKYHATLEHPALIYYGDFDGSGQPQVVEAEYENESLVPIRGRSCSSQAMPFLRDKFKSFHQFALADLDDLYTDERLQQAKRFAATTLDSAVLLNDGQARFTLQSLPELAQVSPIFGIVISEFNGDGHPDVFVAQNFFQPQPETGRMDGGLSLLMLGAGDGTLRAVPTRDSGIVVSGDSRAAVSTDWNGDIWPDLVVAQNDESIVVLEHAAMDGPARLLKVELRASIGNRDAVGACVTLIQADGSSQMREITAGEGYLSQSAPGLVFGNPVDRPVERVRVRWPDGEESEQRVAEGASEVVVVRGL